MPPISFTPRPWAYRPCFLGSSLVRAIVAFQPFPRRAPARASGSTSSRGPRGPALPAIGRGCEPRSKRRASSSAGRPSLKGPECCADPRRRTARCASWLTSIWRSISKCSPGSLAPPFSSTSRPPTAATAQAMADSRPTQTSRSTAPSRKFPSSGTSSGSRAAGCASRPARSMRTASSPPSPRRAGSSTRAQDFHRRSLRCRPIPTLRPA